MKWVKQSTNIFFLLLAFFIGVSLSYAINNQGPEDIVIYGGKLGNIDFPHHRHQNALQDCKICHSIFTKKLGIITQLKTQKKLEKKEVMAKCRACHRAKKDLGLKAGPISCKNCHNRSITLDKYTPTK